MEYALKKRVSLIVVFGFAMSTLLMAVPSEANLGFLRGFVYDEDGKKPLNEAVVLLRETVTGRIYKSGQTTKNGSYKIPEIIPGTYAVGIQYKGKDYNVDALIQVRPKKQLACVTLSKPEDKPGYQVFCRSPRCFFIVPGGWALIAGASAGITYGIMKIIDKECSPCTPCPPAEK